MEIIIYIYHDILSVPTMPPEKPTCRSLTSQSIQVSWDLPLPTGRNGKIQGFKVSYQPAEDWYGKFIYHNYIYIKLFIHTVVTQHIMWNYFPEKNEFETKITTIQYTTIQALLKYTNYSISVFAFTSKGDGVQSDPIYCKTEEDSNTIIIFFRYRFTHKAHCVMFVF